MSLGSTEGLPALGIRFNFDGSGLSTASNALKQFGSNSANITRGIGSAFSKLGSGIGGEFGDVLSQVGSGFDTLGEKGKKLEKLGGVLTGVGLVLTSIGAKDKQARDQLNQAVINSGHDVAEYKDKFETAIKSQENFGHSATDTMAALQKMTQATNDPAKALANMGLVANLAAAQHISLADAAGLVDRIMAGKGARTLAQYGITMPKATNAIADLTKATRAQSIAANNLTSVEDKYKLLQDQLSIKKRVTIADQDRLAIAAQKVTGAQNTLNLANQKLATSHYAAAHAGQAQKDVIDQLSKKIDGQAKASMNNFNAKLNEFKVKALDATAAFGQKFGPAIMVAGPLMSGFGAILGVVKARHVAAAAAALLQAEAETAGTVATEGATAATIGLNVAMLANPIFLVIVAIVALVAGFVMAYKHIKWFHDLVNMVWKGMKTAVVEVWEFIVHAFKRWGKLILLAITGPVGIMVYEVIKNWKAIKTATSAVWNAIKEISEAVWKFILGIIKGYIKMIVGEFHLLVKGFKIIGEGLKDVEDTIVRWFDSLWKLLSGFGSKLYSIGKSTWSFFVKGISDALSGVGDMVSKALNKIPFLGKLLKHVGINITGSATPTLPSNTNSTKSSMTNTANSLVAATKPGTTTIYVQAQGLTVAQVQKEALRKQRVLAAVGG